MSEFDSKALSLARQVMELTSQKHIGGEAQLIAKIQLLFIEAMEYAAPQSNSPVIPDGWKLVPVEPTEAMMLHKSGCQHHAWDDADCAMRQTRRLVWAHMLAAAPGKEG